MPDAADESDVSTVDDLQFSHREQTDQSFENALAKSRNNERSSVDDAVERSTDYTERHRINPDADPLVRMLGPGADGTPLVSIDERSSGSVTLAVSDL